MTSLVLYVGIAVVFLTVWGVIMVGAYLLGDETTVAPMAVTGGPAHDTPAAADRARLR